MSTPVDVSDSHCEVELRYFELGGAKQESPAEDTNASIYA